MVKVGLLGVIAACAATPRPAPVGDSMAAADAALLDGCYDCLRDARRGYGRDPVRRFEADLLIALREKELGLPASDALTEAKEIASRLDPRLEASYYLELVEAVPVEQLVPPRQEARAFAEAHAAFGRRIRAELAWLERGGLRPPVRAYLALALACAYPAGPPRPPPDEPPLLAYRARICHLEDAAGVAQVRARVPRFVETAFFLATTELADYERSGATRLPAYLAELVARFPASPAVSYLAATYARLTGDYPKAVAFYDRILASAPRHDQALLGRAISFSYLRKHDDAIQALGRLVDRPGDDALGEAHYWLAWNEHARGQLVRARTASDDAKRELDEPYVRSLAGVIEYDQADYATAQVDLEAALARAPGDCQAHQYLGAVHRARRRWADAARAFEAAMACFTDRASTGTAKLTALAAITDQDAAQRAREVARLTDEVASDTNQAHRAALAGAVSHVEAGERDAARALIAVVAEEPTLAGAVAKLKAKLDGK